MKKNERSGVLSSNFILMVKKILIALGTIIFIALPSIASAQFPKARMSDCCKTKHDIDVSITIPAANEWNNPVIPGQDCFQVVAGQNRIMENCVVSEKADGAASTCWSKGLEITGVNISTSDWGGVCTMDTIYTVTDFIFWIFLGFSVIMGVYVGIVFMTAGGNPGKIEKARGMIVYLIVGIVVAIAMKLIPSLTRAIVGV